MKILFVNRYFFPDHSATSQLLSDLAFDLANRNTEIVVLASRQVYDNPSASLSAEDNVRGVRVVRMWTSRFGRMNLAGRAIDYLTFYLSAAVHLLLEVDRADIVVAKTDPPLISVVASGVARWKKAKLVNWIQDLFPEIAVELGVKSLRGPVAGVLRWLRNRSLKSAYRNVVLGQQMKNRLIREGVSEASIEIIPNWSDEAAVYPVRRDENPLRKQWNISGKFIVGYSGNMGRAHEFDDILDAAEILRDLTDVIFLFIGDGARRPWIENKVRCRNLSNVILKPYQPREHLADSLSVPDIHFVSLKPRLEGLIVPSKFYGIIAAGRPVLFAGSPTGEIAELIEAAKCGVSVELGDARALARMIEELAGQQRHCEIMGDNARALFTGQYGMERSLAAWRKVLAVG